jgi:integrase
LDTRRFFGLEGGSNVARTIRDANLETRTARGRLKTRGKPHYRTIEPGLHLGYRKPLSGAGKWVVRHYVGDQAYAVETIATADDSADADGVAILDFRQAQAVARERMVKLAHAAAGKHGPVNVADVVEAYLQFLEGNRKSGKDERYRAEALIIAKLGNEDVEKVTRETLQKWLIDVAKAPARLRTKPGKKQNYREPDDDDEAIRRRKSSANRTWTIFRGALNHAYRDGRVSSDAPWRRVKPFKNVDAARVRYLSIAEAHRLLNSCESDFRNLVQAALFTGCRYGELCRLAVHDFNPDSGTLAILISKSGKSRHVVLTDEGVKFFAALCAGRAGDELILRKADGSTWATSHQNRPMADAVAQAHITPAISFHTLRHTYASHTVMNGAPLLVAAKNLGHADTRMVERHYGHLAPSFIADSIRAHAPKFGIEPANVTAFRDRRHG